MSRDERRDRLRDLMERHGVSAIRLRRPENFAWYTGGADNRVDHAAVTGAADIVVTRDSEHVVTTDVEARRMREEQTPAIDVLSHPWAEGPEAVIAELSSGGTVGVDSGGDGLDLSREVAPLRHRLDEAAVHLYRGVGADTESALATSSSQLHPGMTEVEAAACVGQACRRLGLFAPVLLVGGARRLPLHRHPVPAAEQLGSRCLVVVCAERGGLYANVSRIVHFEEPSPELTRRIHACDEVLGRMREATVEGRTLSEVFDDCRRFYADAGFPEEWRRHHQGGLTGYRSREVIAGPGVGLRFETGNAFAWNPSVTGAKAEETFVLGKGGPEVLAAARPAGEG